MWHRARAALLLLLVGVVAGCASPPPPAQPLDDDAQAACEDFAPIGGDVRRGELEGPELYRELQHVYNEARTSENTEVTEAAYRLLSAAINEDREATTAAVTELQQACALPFS